MIRVRLEADPTGGIRGVRISGHSGYAEAGQDIVCAAVSVLGAACVNSLESVCGIQPVVEKNADGALAFRLPEGLSDQQRHDAGILLSGLRQGLEDVAGSYPQYVHIAIQERRT